METRIKTLSMSDISTLPISEVAITGAPVTKPGLLSSMGTRNNTEIGKMESNPRQSHSLLLIRGF
jgi:hypothetical protein